jgi:hypothetical protein
VSSPCVSTALISARPEPGSLRLRFSLSEAATIRYVIRRRVGSPGKPSCPRRAGRRPGRAEPITDGTLTLPAGSSELQFAARQRRCVVRILCAGTPAVRQIPGRRGPNSVRLAALLGGRRLSPGTYTILLRATDLAGNRSAATAIKFWVLSRS